MRLPGWETRLEEALGDCFLRRRPAWGSNDCCTFAATIVEALTGIDPARRLRGTYQTREQAEALMAAAGGIEALVDRQLRESGISVARWETPQLGQRGDPVVFNMGGGVRALGVCYTGARIAALTEHLGVFLPIKRGLVAWRI